MGETTIQTLGVTYTDADGLARQVAWSDLQSIEIATDNGGPLIEDVFWVLRGSKTTLIIPQTAFGTDKLLSRLQQLPGFDSEAVIAAMSSVGKDRFQCWKR